MRYLAVVQYDGTDFVGWQIQPNGRSVEEEIEKVLSQILNTPTKIYGSGRTDAKVHAFGQTFHFDIEEERDLEKFRYSINAVLPKDIHVLSLTKVNDDLKLLLSETEELLNDTRNSIKNYDSAYAQSKNLLSYFEKIASNSSNENPHELLDSIIPYIGAPFSTNSS